MLYDEKIEALISAALADGILTEKEKQVLYKRAQAEEIDLDEFEMVLDARLVDLQKEEKAKKSVENEKAEVIAPKSSKLGDVRKCPNCGAVIGAFQMICPECGFEFSNVGVNEYVKKFAEGLENVAQTTKYGTASLLYSIFDDGRYEQKRREQILERAEARFIRNYPLPMTKEDCVEALNFIQPKISLFGSNATTYAWKKKYDAIVQKMELETGGNKKILEILATYKQKGKVNSLSMFIIWFKSLSQVVKTVIWAIFVYMFLFGLCGLLIKLN